MFIPESNTIILVSSTCFNSLLPIIIDQGFPILISSDPNHTKILINLRNDGLNKLKKIFKLQNRQECVQCQSPREESSLQCFLNLSTI